MQNECSAGRSGGDDACRQRSVGAAGSCMANTVAATDHPVKYINRARYHLRRSPRMGMAAAEREINIHYHTQMW